MVDGYYKGLALIAEGDTEVVFYKQLIIFIASKYKYLLKEKKEPTGEIRLEITTNNGIIIVKLNNVSTITQVPRQAAWVLRSCYGKYKTKWRVFLCYDKDSSKKFISKFYEGDWKNLRDDLLKWGLKTIDLAASYDIEDLFLLDKKGICSFLEIKESEMPQLKGRCGKSKMKNLFRDCGKTYQEGIRALGLIKSLDLQLIIDNSEVPLKILERYIEK